MANLHLIFKPIQLLRLQTAFSIHSTAAVTEFDKVPLTAALDSSSKNPVTIKHLPVRGLQHSTRLPLQQPPAYPSCHITQTNRICSQIESQ